MGISSSQRLSPAEFRRCIFILNDARNLLQEKGLAAHGERYEEATWQCLPT